MTLTPPPPVRVRRQGKDIEFKIDVLPIHWVDGILEVIKAEPESVPSDHTDLYDTDEEEEEEPPEPYEAMLKVKTLKRGYGKPPVKGQIVTIHWTGYGKDGDVNKPFWKQDDFTFELGESGFGMRALDEAPCAMKLGEKCMMQCSEHFGFSKHGHKGMGVPPETAIRVMIELVHIEPLPQEPTLGI